MSSLYEVIRSSLLATFKYAIQVFWGFFFFFCLFAISWAAPAAYGSSQARGQIEAVATSLHHNSRQRRILNPLSKARDRTRNLMVPSRIR